MTTVTYLIPNISCHHCIHTIESEVKELPGVITVKADIATHQAEIQFDSPATEMMIKSLLAEINYPVAE